MEVTPQPGDLVLAHGKGFLSKTIRFGQWLRPSWRPWKYWNHAAIVTRVFDDGKVMCIQMGRKCEQVWLEDVAGPGGKTKIMPAPRGVDTYAALCYARSLIGTKYSYSTIASIAINLLTPKMHHVDFRRAGGSLIYSGLVARAWEHGGWFCPTDPFQITPAEMARVTDKEAVNCRNCLPTS